MTIINIRINQDDSYGEYGISRNDLELNKKIFLENEDGYDNPNNYFQWEIVSWPNVLSNSPTLNNSTATVSNFLPTSSGTYIIKLQIKNILNNKKIKGQIAASIKTEKFNMQIPSLNENDDLLFSWYNINNNLKLLDNYGIFSTNLDEINNIEEKISDGYDYVLIEDSKDGYSKKKVQFNKFYKGEFNHDPFAIHDNINSEIYNIDIKSSPNSNDLLIIEDSEDGYSKKNINLSFTSNLYYVEEKLETIHDSKCYYQLTYIPYDYAISGIFLKSFKNGNIMKYDASLTQSYSYYFDLNNNCIIFNGSPLIEKYVFCYWTDGTIFSLSAVLPTCQTLFGLQQRLIADDGSLNDNFGNSVSIYNNSILIGASQKNSSIGAAYIFIRSDDTWSQYQKLTPSVITGQPKFGAAVDINEDSCIIGAPFDDTKASDGGAAYIFINTGFGWSQEQMITASDGASSDFFGTSVVIDDDNNLCLIGSPGEDTAYSSNGAVYVYNRGAGSWSETQKLFASDIKNYANFGCSINLNLNLNECIIGADGVFIVNGGAYIFFNNLGTWSETQKLTPSDSSSSDNFGTSVCIDVDTCIVGANGNEAAYVFIRTGGGWIQQQKLTASDAIVGDYFGNSVAIYGDTCLVGARLNSDLHENSGKVYRFTRSAGVWTEEQIMYVEEYSKTKKYFGASIDNYTNTYVIGTFELNDNGSTYVFGDI